MEEIISELDQLDIDYREEAIDMIDDEDSGDIVDSETEYDTNSGEDILIYNLSVNGVFNDCSDTQTYFPRIFAEIGI